MTDHTKALEHYSAEHAHAKELAEMKRLREVNAELVAALRDVLGWVPGVAAWYTNAPMKAVERARADLAQSEK